MEHQQQTQIRLLYLTADGDASGTQASTLHCKQLPAKSPAYGTDTWPEVKYPSSSYTSQKTNPSQIAGYRSARDLLSG